MAFEIPDAVKTWSQFGHPILMWVLLGLSVYALYLGIQSRRTRTADKDTRKELIKQNFNSKKRREKIYRIIDEQEAKIYILGCALNNKETLKERLKERTIYGNSMEHGASNINLYKTVEKKMDPIEEDNFCKDAHILSVETDKEIPEVSIQDPILNGIKKAVTNDRNNFH